MIFWIQLLSVTDVVITVFTCRILWIVYLQWLPQWNNTTQSEVLLYLNRTLVNYCKSQRPLSETLKHIWQLQYYMSKIFIPYEVLNRTVGTRLRYYEKRYTKVKIIYSTVSFVLLQYYNFIIKCYPKGMRELKHIFLYGTRGVFSF